MTQERARKPTATMLTHPSGEPLADHVVFRTTDANRAIAQAAPYFAPHRLALHERRVRFLARMNAYRVGSLLLAYLDYGAPLTLRSEELCNRTVLILPLSGRMKLIQAGCDVVATAGSGCVVRPDQPHTLVWDADLTMLALAFDYQELSRQLRRLVGSPADTALSFEPALLPQRRSTIWAGMSHMLTNLVASAGPAGPSPLVATELSRAAMTALLLSQPHNHRTAVTAPIRAAAPGAVRRTAEVMRADPAADHNVAALAEAAGISARSLQAGFRSLYGVSPTQFLRGVRLDKAHEALAASDCADRTVAEIATDWGFGHLGRFAQNYRRRFGQSPSATLRTRSTSS